MSHHVPASRLAISTAIAICEARVCGHSETCAGSGMSTSPATASAAGASAMAGLRQRRGAAAAGRGGQAAEQAEELLRRRLGGAERQHRDAELAGPAEHAGEPRLAHRLHALAHVEAADLERDLQLAVGDD